jgi:hypothetical protein
VGSDALFGERKVGKGIRKGKWCPFQREKDEKGNQK